jgi:hypothetical protein
MSDLQFNTLVQMFTEQGKQLAGIRQEILKAIHGPFQELETEVFTIKSLYGIL